MHKRIALCLAMLLMGFALSDRDVEDGRHSLEQASVSRSDVPAHLVRAFEAADDEINLVYQQARAVVPEKLFVELRESQRTWIPYRDEMAARLALFTVGWPEDAPPVETLPEYWKARTAITEDRTRFLRGWVREFDGSYGGVGRWDGVWVDSYGGRLEVAQTADETLVFHLLVVRGPTAHTGVIGGVARIGESGAHFATSVPGVQQQAEILMTRRGPLIEVETSGPISHFHGVRAYFHGFYARSEVLGPVDRQELIRGIPDAE